MSETEVLGAVCVCVCCKKPCLTQTDMHMWEFGHAHTRTCDTRTLSQLSSDQDSSSQLCGQNIFLREWRIPQGFWKRSFEILTNAEIFTADRSAVCMLQISHCNASQSCRKGLRAGDWKPVSCSWNQLEMIWWCLKTFCRSSSRHYTILTSPNTAQVRATGSCCWYSEQEMFHWSLAVQFPSVSSQCSVWSQFLTDMRGTWFLSL